MVRKSKGNKDKDKEKSFFFSSFAIGLVFGDLSGGKDKEAGGSGFVSLLGIDIGLLVGWTFGIGRKIGVAVTPGIVAGRMGFIVVGVGIHLWQKLGFGIIIPIFPIWVL